MGPVKSPVNIAAGALLKRLRERSGRHLDQLAPNLGVSPAYLNAIEAGTNALPAKSVVGLGDLGLSFLAASALLAMISYLDCRIPNSRMYDLTELQLRVEGLLSSPSIPAFFPFLEWVLASLRNEAGGDAENVARGIGVLEDSLNQLSSPGPIDQTANTETSLPHQALSPMMEDMLDTVSSGLALVTPLISRFKFKAWERLNAGRMHEVRAYVDDVDRFLEDAPEFDWHSILLNSHRPRLSIMVPGKTSLSEEALAEQFYEQIPLYNRSESQLAGVKGQIRFKRIASKNSENDISRGLVYDFSQGQLVSEAIWQSPGKKLLNQKRFYQFNNAWLYELRSYGGAQPGGKVIAILGAYNDNELSSFGVFLDREDSRTWWELTGEIIG